MGKADLDRKLYQYQRQLSAPEEFSSRFPAISKTVSPYLMHMSDKDVYNTLGKNTNRDQSPFGWQREAETNASSALNQDIYKAKSLSELAEKLKNEDDLKYDVANESENEKKDMSGVFDPNRNEMRLRGGQMDPDSIDTVFHEHGHARDFNAMPGLFVKNKPFEGRQNMAVVPPNDLVPTEEIPAPHLTELIDDSGKPGSNLRPNEFVPERVDMWNSMKNTGDLWDLADAVSSGHFNDPRSHSINNLIETATKAGSQLGLERNPDQDPNYDELNPIKDTLKQLKAYDRFKNIKNHIK